MTALQRWRREGLCTIDSNCVLKVKHCGAAILALNREEIVRGAWRGARKLVNSILERRELKDEEYDSYLA